MDHAATPAIRHRRGRPSKSTHPFVLALEARGSNVAEWARRNGVDRAVAKAWIARGKGARRIPRVFADRIAAEFGTPATEATWPQGIRE